MNVCPFRYVEPSICNMDVLIPLQPIYMPINEQRLKLLLDNIKSKIPDSIRVITYDVEGNPYINNLFFDGTTITFILDETKGFELPGILGKPTLQTFTGTNIEKKEDSKKVIYTLKNNDEIVVQIFSYLKPPLPVDRS